MLNSKQIVSGVLGFVLLMGLTSCWEPKEQKSNFERGFSTANFLVKLVDGDALPTEEVTPNWLIPKSRHYHFWSCLRNRATDQIIRGIGFTVKSDDSKIEVVTDNEGCLHWHEKIDFDYLAEEAYLQLERTVSGTGIYQGEQKIQLAINPWVVSRKSGLKEVKWERDSQGTDIPDGIKVIGKNQVKSVLRGAYKGNLPSAHAQGPKLLWMNRVSSNIKEIKQDAQGVWLQIQLSMIPVAQFRDLSGSPNPTPLKAGRFRVDAQIVATNLGVNRDENLILTPDLPSSVGVITNNDGILRVQFDSMITRRVARGNIQLALRVTPIDGAPEGLGSFEGLYELGPFDKLESRNTDMFVPASVYSEGDGFAYEKFLKNAGNFEKLEAARSAFKNEPFEFPKMLIKFETIRPGETATTRTVDYSIQACVRNTLTSSFVKDELFYVDYLPDNKTLELEKDFYTHENEMNSPDNKIWCKSDGSSPKPGQDCRPLSKTDQDGCLRIMGHVTHKYYKPEELFFPTIRIRHVASTYSKELVLAINPWDLFATFGRDRRELTDDYVEASKKREKISSLLYVPAFSYHTLRFRYEIDEFMNLVVKKVLLLKLEPKVLRYSSITDGRKNIGHLRDGIYLLKLAVQKDYLDPAAEGVVIGFDEDQQKTYVEAPKKAKTREYINGIKKLVRVQDGEIITPVEIAVRDLRLLRIRSNMLIQLETIDEKNLTMSAIVHSNAKEHLSKGNTEGVNIDQRNKLLTDMTYSLSSFLWAGRQEGNLLVPKKNEGNLPGIYQITSKKYLAEIDHLRSGMTEEFLSKMKAEAVQAYKTNDVSFMPVAPYVELDSLRDLDSGLAPRSFSGPVTLLLNSNMSYIRPLDNLDESFCEATDDCREVSKTIDEMTGGERAKIEDRDYRDSPLFGSIRHLSSINVDTILQRMTVLEEEYRKSNTISSLLYNFINQTGLDFVSLGDVPLKRFDQEKCSSMREYSVNEEKCLVPAPEVSTSFENFLSDLNNQGQSTYYQLPGENVNRGDIEKLIETGEIDPRVDSRFCDLFGRQMNRVWKDWDPRGLTVVSDWLKGIGWACVDRQRSHDGVSVGFFSLGKRSPGLIFERKLKVLKTGRYRFKGGKPMNISVGVNFGVNYNKSFSGGWNYNIFGEIPILGSILKFFSLKEERTRSNTNGTSVGEGAYLAMQEATMDVEILEHEKCLIVRPHPEFVKSIVDRVNFNVKAVTMRIRDRVKFKMGLSKLDYGKAMSPGDDTDVTEKELVLRQFLRGIMLCGGKKIKEPTPVREKYYYFSQHFTEGDLLDSADLYNHPWLLALRGKRDFQGFMAVIKAVPYNWNFSEVAKAEGWSIDHMIRSYRQVHPTFPGLYSILDDGPSSASAPQYPLQDKPGDSFRDGVLDGKNNSEEKAP
ncbi:MAG: hypothetical protein IPJ71_01690 [Bdellovibrionales bacterium]|nr:hypothetical protein [Bdellovibrionales bacterium]